MSKAEPGQRVGVGVDVRARAEPGSGVEMEQETITFPAPPPTPARAIMLAHAAFALFSNLAHALTFASDSAPASPKLH